MWTVQQQELLAERVHYEILAGLVPNNRFNAIKYLYDRLNIIDAKAQGLLTRNGLLLTTVSIVASSQLSRGVTGQMHFLFDDAWRGAFAAAFLLLVFSTLATMGIMFLRFDAITVLPAPYPGQDDGGPDRERIRQAIQDLRREEDRRGLPPGSRRSDRSLREYEDAFFEITIRRQRSLRLAQRCTITATLLFFAIIGKIFASAAGWAA